MLSQHSWISFSFWSSRVYTGTDQFFENSIVWKLQRNHLNVQTNKRCMVVRYFAAFQKGAKLFWSRQWYRLHETFGCSLPPACHPPNHCMKSQVKMLHVPPGEMCASPPCLTCHPPNDMCHPLWLATTPSSERSSPRTRQRWQRSTLTFVAKPLVTSLPLKKARSRIGAPVVLPATGPLV